MIQGIPAGVGAYLVWGLFPLYWKWLAAVPALETVSHRIVWSMLMLVAFLGWRGRLGALAPALRDPRALAMSALCGAMIALNWGAFIWGVAAGRTVEVSLGYFLTPLVSVVLSRIFLGERLPWGQLAGVGLASAGVLWLASVLDEVPWVSLTLALSFGVYGLAKKQVRLAPAEGMLVETGALAPLALGLLVWLAAQGQGAFLHAGPTVDLLLVGGGLVTLTPLLLFATAAQTVSLSMLGMLQYIAPTIHLAIGVFVFGEPFSEGRLVGFAAVWAGLVVFLIAHRRAQRLRAEESRP